MRTPVRTFLGRGVLLLAFLVAALPCLGDEERPPAPLRLTIERIEDAPAESLAVLATVENVSDKPVAFDRKFAVFLVWQVTTDDGNAVKTEPVADVERSDEERDKSRFVTLGQGETLSAEFRLAEEVRLFETGHGAFPEGDVPTGYETVRRYSVPADGPAATVRLMYDPGDDGYGGFYVWFGYVARDVGLWTGRAASEPLRSELRERP